MEGIRLPALLAVLSVTGAMAGIRFDPISEARGGTWLRTGADPWVTLSCQPLLAGMSGIRLGVIHSPGMFGLKELGRSAIAVAALTGAGGAGIALTTFGGRRYRETGLTAGVGTGAGGILFGGAVRLRHVSIPGYGSGVAVGVDAALVVRHGSRFLWGMKIVNLNRPALGSSGERAGPDISGELTVLPAEQLEITLHVGNEYDRPLSLRAGLTGHLSPELNFICGVSGDFTRLHAGMEWALPGVSIGYSLSIHPVLGWTNLFSLGVLLVE